MKTLEFHEVNNLDVINYEEILEEVKSLVDRLALIKTDIKLESIPKEKLSDDISDVREDFHAWEADWKPRGNVGKLCPYLVNNFS